MIQPGMAEHYGLINVPSVVTADSKRFINDEYSRKDFEELEMKILSVLKSPKTLVLACLALTMPVFAADVSLPVQNKGLS